MFDVKKMLNFKDLLTKEVVSFVIKACMMLSIWLILDQILSIDLGIMYSMQKQGILLLNAITDLDYQATQVYLTENRPKFGIVCDSSWLKVGKTCDGKSIMFMYLSFVMIYPQIKFWRRVKYGFLGLLLIHEFNVVRIVMLTLILQYSPKNFPMMHHYFFQVVMYALIFLLVRAFLKQSDAGNLSQTQAIL